MLKKLLKYELRATARSFVPLYLALLVLTVTGRLFTIINSSMGFTNTLLDVTGGFNMVLYACVIVAIMVMTVVVTISRFYKNLLTDEGYLMFTLPVSVRQQVLSKLITSFCWMVVSAVVTALSLMLLCMSFQDFAALLRNLGSLLQVFFTKFQIDYFLFPLELLVLLGTFVLAEILQFYVSISLGQAVSQKNRIVGAVGVYLLITFAFQIAFTVLLTVSSVVGNWDLAVFTDLFNWVNNNPTAALHLFLLSGIAVNTGIGALFYWGTARSLTKRLNLA